MVAVYMECGDIIISTISVYEGLSGKRQATNGAQRLINCT